MSKRRRLVGDITPAQIGLINKLRRERSEEPGPLPSTKQGASALITRLLDPSTAPVRATRDVRRMEAIEAAPMASARRRQRREEAERAAAELPARARSDAPTETQLHDLAVLARRAGEPVPVVTTATEASRELVRLRRG